MSLRHLTCGHRLGFPHAGRRPGRRGHDCPRLHRALGDTEHARGLGDRHAVHVGEHEDEALRLGQRGEGVLDEQPGVDLRGPVRTRGQARRRPLVELVEGVRRPGPAQTVQARVDDDAVQPGRHGCVAAITFRAAEGGEAVLDGVGRQLGVAAYREGDAHMRSR